MQEDLIAKGLELMLFGMGTVVLFLLLLVLATGMMSRLMARYFPELQSPEATVPTPADTVTATADDPHLVAVITAAVHRHRAAARVMSGSDSRNR
jgi:oxaloacetate decarboxylase gamma subunit